MAVMGKKRGEKSQGREKKTPITETIRANI